jgi:hypothetical protein
MLSTLGHSLDSKSFLVKTIHYLTTLILAQIPTLGFRRSTPNIFQSLENTPNSAQAINAAISRLLTPQNLSALSPTGGPSLSRQSSIGGFGFIDPSLNQPN